MSILTTHISSFVFRWRGECWDASSWASPTGYSPLVRKIRRRWKSPRLAKRWCCRWWLWPVSARTRRRTRKPCGRRNWSSTQRWRTLGIPRVNRRRRDRRAEDDKENENDDERSCVVCGRKREEMCIKTRIKITTNYFVPLTFCFKKRRNGGKTQEREGEESSV